MHCRVWDLWSKAGTKYPGERQIATQWHSFRADKATSVTLGSLFKLARDAGWERPQVDASGLFSPTGGQDLPHHHSTHSPGSWTALALSCRRAG